MTILYSLLLAPVLLAILYPLAIQYERGGRWKWIYPLTLIALVLDVISNYTSLALYTWDFPKKGEYTFTKRLNRLRLDAGWRGHLAWAVCVYLDFFDPNGFHCEK
ncbi:MAG: hypothetical protein ACYC36_03800 [Bellilinea sp.]